MAVEALGTGFIEIVPDTRGFGKDVEKDLDRELGGAADKVNDKVGSGMAGAFKKVGAAVAAAGVGAFFKSSIDAATDTAEQVSKVGVVFGEAGDSVLAFGEQATDSMGASKVEALEAAATFGNLLTSVGLSEKAAAGMSTEMVQLAGDLASFNNVPVGEALDAIRSGLVGETEPLKKFAVNLNEATLKAKAMELGLTDGKGTLDSNAKAQAAYAIIMEQTSKAQGDFARTGESLANQQRKLSAEFANAKAEVGEALAPAMLTLVKVARDLMPLLGGTAEAVAGIGAAVGPIISVFGKLAGSPVGEALVTFAVGAGTVMAAYSKLSPIIGTVTSALGLQAGAHAATAGAAALEAGSVELATGVDLLQAESSQAAAVANLEQAAAATASGTASAAGASGVSSLATGLLSVGPAAIVAATAAGIGLLAFKDWQAAGRELAEQQERVNKMMLEAGDPASILADNYDKIGASLEEVAVEQKTVTDAKGREKVATDLLNTALEDHGAALAEAGYSQEQVRGAVLAGGEAFDQMLASMNKVDPATGGLREGLYNLSGAIQTVEQDLRDSTGASADRIEKTLEEAHTLGILSQADLDSAKATSGSTDADLQWIAAGEALEGKLEAVVVQREAARQAAEREAEATDKAVQSAVQAIDPNARLAQAEDDLKAATDGVKDAMDAAKRTQDEWLFGVVDQQAELDDVTKASNSYRDATKDLTQEQINAALAGTDSSVASLKVRDAYSSLVHESVDAVEAIQKTTSSSEEATAAQANFAQQQYDLAISMGYPQEQAELLRQKILEVPTSHNTDMDVAQHGAELAKAQIDSASADVDTEIRVHATLESVGISQGLIDSAREQIARGTRLAEGGMVHARPGGTLALIGEGGRDEAVVPMGPNFAADLARIVGPRAMAQLGGSGGDTTINVSVAGGLSGPSEAQHLGRIVGETAAQVLAQRQLATAVRVA